MEPVNAAVVGVGFMGLQHAQAYARNPLSRLVAVADLDEERAQTVAKRLGVRAYSNAEEMLDGSDVDAVSICTNDESHVGPTMACLGRDTHVLLEKPIATTMEDADAVIDASRRSRGKLLVGQIVRFEPRYAHVKERVERGDLGDLATIYARRLNHVGSQDRLRGRVSVLSFLGVHDFDYILWLSRSRPARLYTESVAMVHRAAGYEIEDHTYTLIRFNDGMVACVEAGWILPNAHPRRADFKLQVIGTRGMAQIDLVSGDIVVGTQKGWEVPGISSMLDREIDHFLDCVTSDRSPLVTGDDARRALELSLAAQRSSRTGEIVRF